MSTITFTRYYYLFFLFILVSAIERSGVDFPQWLCAVKNDFVIDETFVLIFPPDIRDNSCAKKSISSVASATSDQSGLKRRNSPVKVKPL